LSKRGEEAQRRGDASHRKFDTSRNSHQRSSQRRPDDELHGTLVPRGVVVIVEEASEQDVAMQEWEEPLPQTKSDPHRKDLCEACIRFGDCLGFFTEPFLLLMSARMLDKQQGTQVEGGPDALQWDLQDDRLALDGGFGSVALRPHVYEEPAAIISPDEASQIAASRRVSFVAQGPPSPGSDVGSSSAVTELTTMTAPAALAPRQCLLLGAKLLSADRDLVYACQLQPGDRLCSVSAEPDGFAFAETTVKALRRLPARDRDIVSVCLSHDADSSGGRSIGTMSLTSDHSV